MTSFFRAIRGYFKSDYDGRYLSLLLREIALHEPDSMAALLDVAAAKSKSPLWRKLRTDFRQGAYAVKCEVAFGRKGKRRRADLAFLSGREIRLLFEVKEYDDTNPNNDKQIDDYLIEAERGIGFIYVYRFNPQQEYYRRLAALQNSRKPVVTISYGEIYKTLKKEDAPLASLLCRYMEDIGVGVYREFERSDDRPVSFLLVQLLGFPNKTGLGRLQSDEATRSVPKLFETLLGNMEVNRRSRQERQH